MEHHRPHLRAPTGTFSRYTGITGYGTTPFSPYVGVPGFMDSSPLFSQRMRSGYGASQAQRLGHHNPLGLHSPFSQYNAGGSPFRGRLGSLGMGYHVGADSLQDRWGLRATRGPIWW